MNMGASPHTPTMEKQERESIYPLANEFSTARSELAGSAVPTIGCGRQGAGEHSALPFLPFPGNGVWDETPWLPITLDRGRA